MTARALTTAALVVAGALAGCYGSTERVTDVEPEAAVLRGQGTANSGPAQTYFEYWPTAEPGTRSRTPTVDWPAGASGAFGQRVIGLRSGTHYAVRLCGNDRGRPPVCAQQRTFETQSPDRIAGSAADASGTVQVDASSGPSGERPNGTIRFVGTSGGQTSVFQGTVVCLTVRGATAVVGYTGRGFVGGVPGPVTTGYAKVVADPRPGRSTFDHRGGPHTSSPDCGSYDGGGTLMTGDLTVTDAQPPAPPT